MALVVAGALLWKTQEVTTGVRAGLNTCASIVIPSLFPFMVLAGILSTTSVGQVLSSGVWKLTHRLIPLPRQLGAVFLMSFLGGFPVGARMLSDLVKQKRIDPDTASRALCFCVNAGPSFLISAVGVNMLGSGPAGLALLGAQVASALVIARLSFPKRREFPVGPTPPYPPFANAFVESVRSACGGILSICAFVITFSAITALLRSTGLLEAMARGLGEMTGMETSFALALFTGILEVTAGCLNASALGGEQGFLLCAFLVSFSSLSILFQVRSCFPVDSPVQFRRLAGSRFLHGALTTGFASLLFRLLPSAALPAGNFSGALIPKTTPHMAATTLCLICMCTILVLFPSRQRG